MSQEAKSLEAKAPDAKVPERKGTDPKDARAARGRAAAAEKARRPRRAADVFVILAMAVVTVALGVMLHQQFELAPWLSAIAALSVYVGLLAIHTLVKRSDRLEQLAAEVARLEAEVARLGAARGAVAVPAAARAPSYARGPVVEPRAAAHQPVAAEPAASAPVQSAPAQPAPTQSAPTQSAPVQPAPVQSAPATPQAVAGHRPPPLPDGRIAEDGGSLKELWSFRPDAQARIAAGAWPDPTPSPSSAPRREPALPPAVAAEPEAAPASPREADVEMIQGLIKKLADQVNAAEAAAVKPVAATDNRAVDTAIHNSLRALRATAETMRDVDAPPAIVSAAPPVAAPRAEPPRAAHAGLHAPQPHEPAATLTAAAPPPLPPAQPEAVAVRAPVVTASAVPPAEAPRPPQPAVHTPTAPPADARLSAIGEALAAGRVEVMLDPILGLTDQRARHYEVSLRLRDRTGRGIDVAQTGEELGGTGLLPLLDCARLDRSAQVAQRLAEKGRPGALFTGMSGEALGHDQFLSDFADVYATRNAIADQLVLTIAQGDVNVFGARDWDTLAEMRDLGFRFALGAVTDLDMDFEALKQQGFDFVKLDAGVFLDGMPAAGGVVPASDICRHLSSLGMTLIVGEIADEAQLARIFGFGVLFGQGQLFGGPRPMKIAAAKPSGHLAA